MDLGLDMPASQEQDTKRRAVMSKTEASRQEGANRLMVATAKLCLSNAQASRTLMAVVVYHGKCKEDDSWIVKIQQTTKKYTELAAKLREEGKTQDQIKEALGLPSTQAFNEVIKLYLGVMEKEGKMEAKAEMDKAVLTWNAQQGGWKLLNKHIPIFKVQKMFNAKDKKLVVAAPQCANEKTMEVHSPSWAWTVLKNWMNGLGMKDMEGVAPPSNLERVVQESIDLLQENS